MKTKKDLKKFTWRDVVFFISYFAIQILVVIAGGIIYMVIQMGSGAIDPTSVSTDALTTQMTPMLIWTTILSGVATAILAVVLYWRLLKEQVRDFGKNWKKFTIIIVLGYALIFVIEMLFSYLVNVETSANQIALEEMFANATIFQLIGLQILVIITAPIVEEFLFRKVMFGSYKHNKIAAPIMFVFSSVMFGLFHYGFDGQFIVLVPYMIMGAVMAAAYWRTDNILVPIGIHFANNAIASILILIFFSLS
ncbi:MAG: lysostaphin resistance A-like protein [Carnobacterium maltaromaticum]